MPDCKNDAVDFGGVKLRRAQYGGDGPQSTRWQMERSRDPEGEIERLERSILARVAPAQRPAVAELLEQLGDAQARRGYDWIDETWRGVASTLVKRGHKDAWLETYYDLAEGHGLYEAEQPNDAEAWQIAGMLTVVPPA